MNEYTPQYQRASRLVTSRKVKNEENTAVRQTILIGLAAVIFLILSVVFIIPGVVRFLGGLSNSPTTTEQTDVPPQVPQFSLPADATSSATINLSGFTTPKAKVYILKNGSEAKVVDVDDSGNFSTDIDLDQGENHFSAYAKNGDLSSATSEQFVVIFDNQKPDIEITEPTDGQSIQGKKNQNVTVKGKTKPGSKIYLNDRLFFLQDDGTFTTTQRLENGANSLSFKVIDRAGNETEKVITVNFQE